MKNPIGVLGPIAGILAGILIMGLFVFNTVTDSPWRWLGFGLGTAAFIICVAVAIRSEKQRP